MVICNFTINLHIVISRRTPGIARVFLWFHTQNEGHDRMSSKSQDFRANCCRQKEIWMRFILN